VAADLDLLAQLLRHDSTRRYFGDFTEEVAAHTNQVIGGLINATFGNAVEVVVAIQALLADEIRVVQASMIGSIFSNLLLVSRMLFLLWWAKAQRTILQRDSSDGQYESFGAELDRTRLANSLCFLLRNSG
jgi:calcium/proton exchanger cax